MNDSLIIAVIGVLLLTISIIKFRKRKEIKEDNIKSLKAKVTDVREDEYTSTDYDFDSGCDFTKSYTRYVYEFTIENGIVFHETFDFKDYEVGKIVKVYTDGQTYSVDINKVADKLTKMSWIKLADIVYVCLLGTYIAGNSLYIFIAIPVCAMISIIIAKL
jgi:hypothetical protein